MMAFPILPILFYIVLPTLQQESNSFLIYNEKLMKCLQAQNRVIKLANCMKDDNLQKFRWISKHQLVNVAKAQCLGVSSLSDLSLVSLSSCNGVDELQKWECKNDTLFGNQGKDLYLNYDKAKDKVNIQKVTGDWSHWKIYGTLDDLCVKAYEEIYSIKGNNNGQPCVFPFKFESKWYGDCTTVGAKEADLWCSSTSDYDKDKKWGYCPLKTTRVGWWTTDSITGSEYQVNENAALTWYQARRSCHQQNAELLSITELHEQTYISGLTSVTKAALWVGLNSLDLNAGWKWSDGSPFRYLKWLPGSPSLEDGKSCVALESNRNAMWESKECSQNLGYICKKSNTTSTYTPPSGTEPIYCPPGWIPYAGYCYSLRKDEKIWQEAKVACRKEEGDLASLHNIEESSFVISNFEFDNAKHVWLGLNDLKTQMFFEWSDGTPVTYTVWEKGEPSHIDNRQEDCVALYTKLGHWTDQACEKKFPYICKRKPVPTDHELVPVDDPGCSTGWKRHGFYCYFIGEEMSTFAEANSTCNTHAAFLTTVEDRFEQAYLTSLVGLREEKYFWTGLSDMEERGTFKWTTKGRVLYTHWDAEMPGRKQGCVAVQTGKKGGLWDVISCDEKAKFVCKKLAQGVTPPPIPVTTPEPTCVPEWKPSQYSSNCYRYFTRPKGEQKSWSEARDFCRALGGDLLSIKSKQEQDAIHKMLLSVDRSAGGWIGLVSSDPDEGFQWSDGSPLTYENWGFGEPNNHQGAELCGEIINRYSIYWNDVHCDHLKNWICELQKGVQPHPEPTSPANLEFKVNPDGWLIKGDRSYYFGNDEVDMDKARAFCKSNHGDLATINDGEERNFLWRFILKNKTSESFYIGMQLSQDKQLKWIDGSPVDYVAWAVNEPNFSNNDENCVVLNKHLGHWYDINCGSPCSYICERKTSNINTTLAPTVPAPRGGCPAEWIAFERKCYKIFGKEEDDLLDWHTAREHCQQNEGNLASIPNDLIQDFLTYNLRDFKHSVWTGLNDINQQSKYLWTDQSGVYYTNWAKGHPSYSSYHYSYSSSEENVGKNCVSIKVDEEFDAGAWIEKDCELTMGFICHKSENPAMPVMTTVAPASGQYEYSGYHYKVETKKMKWDDAQLMCKQSDFQLASILDQYTASFIRVHLHKFKEPFWIGLYSNNQTDNRYRWSDGWGLRYTKWASQEPKKKADCVYIDTDGQWKTASCDENYASLCKQSSVTAPSARPQKPGKCPNSSQRWIPYHSYCYLLEASDTTSWGGAHLKCVQHGGELVSIEDQHEADFLTEHTNLLKNEMDSFWIGLFKNVEGSWLWIDKTPTDYVNWHQGEPADGSECILMDAKTGTWRSKFCYSYRGFICKTAKIPESPGNTTKSETSKQGQNKPAHGTAVGVSIVVIAVIAAAVIAVYFVYKKKHKQAPPTEKSFDNTLYFNRNHDTPSQDTNILVNNMEQL